MAAERKRREEEEQARRHTRFDDRGRRKTNGKRRKKRDDNLVLTVLPGAEKSRKGGLSTIMKPSAEALDFASQIMGGSSRGVTRMSRSQFQGQKRIGAPRQFRS